ncbi:uncharacterized protein LOC124153203 [Ischnura elegans]|uniref:uncharacterized protein LOC124153203 n=1 Tax=Ischnura elegans TaxID=197161 RepID=UPI001ED8B319|nr:uncharacterized protein LOC124153203 [Ischnura elegans]
MNALAFALSVTFMVGVSAFPMGTYLTEQPLAAVYVLPRPKLIPLQLHTRAEDEDLQPRDEDHTAQVDESGTDIEEIHEPPSELDPPAHVAPSIRSRRSTQPGAPSPQGGQSGDRGGVEVGVSRGEGGSRRVEARGEGNVWQSNDGRGRVDVHGHYSRDYGGRYGTQRPQYGGGIRYSHRFKNMKGLVLALSAILMVGVSALPTIRDLRDSPVGAVLLIPRHEAVLPVELMIANSERAPMDFIMKTRDDESVDEEQWNEPPSDQDPSANVPPSIRSRRSTQPGAPSPQGGQSGDRGGVEVGVSRGEGGSRRVEARGEGNVWQSNDGRGRVDVHGHYSRGYGGRYGTQRPQYGGGIRYSHRF